MRPRLWLPLASAIALFGALAVLPFDVGAAVQDCATADVSDPADDVEASPASASSVTGFDQIDIRGLCVAETAADVHLVLTVGATVTTNGHDFSWTIGFQHDGSAKTVRLSSSGGQNAFDPPGAGEISGSRIQFNLDTDAYPLGSRLTAFVIATQGTFVPTVGQIVTGSDRAPDAAGTSAPFAYRVGARAPEGQDSDQDGVPDRNEVAAGSDPGKADTDDDGLSDGVEARQGTNATNADSDGDGLLDGDNLTLSLSTGRAQALARIQTPITLPDGMVKFVGELGVGTSATTLDSDADGIIDGDEVKGTANSRYPRNYYFEEYPGSTNPARVDSDGDGLLDGEETAGRATIDGERTDFPSTDPNSRDTDGDTLTDREELVGLVAFPKENVRFTPTDPTKGDTDGDGFDDYQELSAGSNPHDPGAAPRGGGPESEASYFLLSALALLVLVFLGAAGILWRWA